MLGGWSMQPLARLGVGVHGIPHQNLQLRERQANLSNCMIIDE
jgi:hypothetical protein